MHKMGPKVVLPGVLLGPSSRYALGDNVYERNGSLYSSALGVVRVTTVADSPLKQMSVETANAKQPYVGCIVLAQVVRISRKQAECNIICVDDKPLDHYQKGILIPNNIHEAKTLDTTLVNWFRPGDTIRAHVVSTGDGKVAVLSTANIYQGVVKAISAKGDAMVPISWKYFMDPAKSVEKRKSAKELGK